LKPLSLASLSFVPGFFATLAVLSWKPTIASNLQNWASSTFLCRTTILVPQKGTLRGLHYQTHHSQAKLYRVVEGEALDVAVDIRAGSPHFGKWASVRLSATDHNQMFIPAGFAHGFLALTDSVQLLYKCSDFYDPNDEHGILWNDPDINIEWGVTSPLVSEKDAKNSKLADVPRDLLPRYSSK
jgi:dTDP-4-dehydrorhamnose 3,5-epimerase